MKEIRVTRTKNLTHGGGSIEGKCDLCGSFPCIHVTEQGYFVGDNIWKLNDREELRLIQRLLLKEKQRLEAIKKRSSVEDHYLHLAKWLLNEATKLEEGWKGE